MNGPQPVDRMEQGDKADSLRPRQRLEAYQGIDELPGMHPEPLQGHLHMTQWCLSLDGQLQPLGQQKVLLQGLAETDRRI